MIKKILIGAAAVVLGVLAIRLLFWVLQVAFSLIFFVGTIALVAVVAIPFYYWISKKLLK